jgi:threonine/homoserine/homoserine lactone efflux protein
MKANIRSIRKSLVLCRYDRYMEDVVAFVAFAAVIVVVPGPDRRLVNAVAGTVLTALGVRLAFERR